MYQQGYTFFNCKHEHKGKQPWKIDKKKLFHLLLTNIQPNSISSEKKRHEGNLNL